MLLIFALILGISIKLYGEINTMINAPLLTIKPVIDGNLSEWRDLAHNDGVWDINRTKNSTFYQFDRGNRNRLTNHGENSSLEEDLQARYFIAWDHTHLYLGAEVHDNVRDITDPDPAPKRWYFRDAICWFIEAPRDRASEFFGQGDNAFCFTASPKKIEHYAWWRHGNSKETYIEEPLPQTESSYMVIDKPEWGAGGFALEAKVSFSETFKASDPHWTPPSIGDEYSIEIVHTDPDGGDYGGHFMIYGNGDDDNTWAPLILSGPSSEIIRLEE